MRVIGRSAERLQRFVELGADARAGLLTDAAFLTDAFSGASGLLAVVPGDYREPDFRGMQNIIGHAQAEAIEEFAQVFARVFKQQ